MRVAPNFQDYQRAHANEYDGDSGRWTGLSEEDFNKMSDEDKWGTVGNSIAVAANDPRYADLKPLVGGEDGRSVVLTTGSMQDFHGGLVDPAAEYHGDNFFAHSEDNQTPKLQSYGHAKYPWLMPLLVAGGFLGAGALAGAFDGTAAGAAGAAGAADESAGLSMASPFAEGSAAAGGGAGASTTGAATTAGGSTTSGIINGARTVGSNMMGWYNGLTPASRFIVTQGLSSGARALLSANAQREAINAQRERDETQHQNDVDAEQRARDDHARRTHVSAFGSAFKPRGGIIDSQRNGG